MSFDQSKIGETKYEDPVPGCNGHLFPEIKCFRCNWKGHYANKCEIVNTGMMGVQQGVTFTHGKETVLIKDTWILLDSCTIDSCTNKMSYLQYVKDCNYDEMLHLKTTAMQPCAVPIFEI